MLRQRVPLRKWYQVSRILSKFSHTPRKSHLIGRLNDDSNVVRNIRNLSTAAHKYEAPAEQVDQFDDVQVHSIDESLAKIDETARQFGRVLRKDVLSVFESIKTLGEASSMQSLYLIRCCGTLMRDQISSRRSEMLNEIWSKIRELQIPIDVSHYNAVLKAYLENDFAFSPVNFLAEMERDGVEANRVTYQRLIDKYCDEGDLSGASAVLQYMKDKEMPVNEAVFNSLVKGHMKVGDFDGAKNMFDVMRKSQLSPGADTYSVLACGFAEKGDIEAILSAFKEAEETGIFLSNKVFLSVIHELAVSGHDQHIDAVFSCLQNLNLSRQDCVNLIYDLQNKGLEDVGYRIMENICSQIDFQSGIAHFLRQLAFLEMPAEKIVAYCKDIKKNGFNDFALHQTTRFALGFSNIDLAVGLMTEMEKEGVPLRSHYFWPMLAIHAKNPNENEKINGISNVLRLMHNFGIPTDVDTYWDFVFPHVNTKDPEHVVKFVKDAGQSERLVIDPLFRYYCDKKDFKKALYLCQNHGYYGTWDFLFRQLVKHYNGRKDNAKDVLEILQSVHKNSSSKLGYQYRDLEEVYGNFLLLLSSEQNLPRSLLAECHRMGIRIHSSYVRAICRNIGEFDAEATQIVRSLQAGLSSSTSSLYPERAVHPRDMNLEALENHLLQLQASGESTRLALRQLLNLYCKNRDIDKIREVKQQLDEQGFLYTPSMYAILIEAFVTVNDIDEAEKLKNKMEEDCPSVKLDALKAISYASLLVKCNRQDDAVAFLHDQCEEISFGQKDVLIRALKKLLNITADGGNVELTKTLFDFFESKLNITDPKYLLDCFVKVHLQKDDIETAIMEYDRCMTKYRFGPCRNLLFKKCIMTKDFERLQKVVDLTAVHNGKTSTLHELAYSFIECGQVQQAYKVFQNLSGRADMGYILDLSMRFVRENKDTLLEDLIVATRDLSHIDRDRLYYNLLSLHGQNNDYEKALAIWDTMQEESIQPNANTLRLLASILEKNDQPIPFVVPKGKMDSFDGSPVGAEPVDFHDTRPGVITELLNCIETSGDHVAVLEILNNMKKGHIRSLTTEGLASIVELFLTQGSVKALCNNVQLMSYILEKSRAIFKPLMERYAEAGDVQMIRQILEFLPDFTLKSISFNFYFTKAHITSGQYEQLLSELENQVGKGVKLFSVTGFLTLLEQAPHLEERVANLVEQYHREESFDIPKRTMWVHYFVTERLDKADEIFRKNPEMFTNMDMLGTQVLKIIRSSKNAKLGRNFIDFVNKYEIKQIVKDRAYSNLLDVLVEKAELKEAASILEEAQKQDVSINRFNRNTLLSLKSALEEKKMTVSFDVPMKEDTSSSSDSD